MKFNFYAHDRLRNYISKPWFLDTIKGTGPSPLAKQIADVLGAETKPDHIAPNGNIAKPAL